MKLKYIGKTIDEVGVVPLPEGWTAKDHDEPDAARAAEKLASGSYIKAEPDQTSEPAAKPVDTPADLEPEPTADTEPAAKPHSTHRKKE